MKSLFERMSLPASNFDFQLKPSLKYHVQKLIKSNSNSNLSAPLPTQLSSFLFPDSTNLANKLLAHRGEQGKSVPTKQKTIEGLSSIVIPAESSTGDFTEMKKNGGKNTFMENSDNKLFEQIAKKSHENTQLNSDPQQMVFDSDDNDDEDEAAEQGMELRVFFEQIQNEEDYTVYANNFENKKIIGMCPKKTDEIIFGLEGSEIVNFDLKTKGIKTVAKLSLTGQIDHIFIDSKSNILFELKENLYLCKPHDKHELLHPTQFHCKF